MVVPGRVELPTHPCEGYVITVSPQNFEKNQKNGSSAQNRTANSSTSRIRDNRFTTELLLAV